MSATTPKPKDFPLSRELIGAGHLATLAGLATPDLETGIPVLDEPLREALHRAPRADFRQLIEQQADGAQINLGDVLDEVEQIERELGRLRIGFAFTAFQYLGATILTTWAHALDDPLAYLDGRTELTEQVNSAGQHKTVFDDPTAELLRRLALWMATGSGKTLMGHVVWHLWNRRRVSRRGLGKLTSVLLVTPNERLTTQHIAEFAASGIPCVHYADRGATHTGAVIAIEITKLRPRGSAAPREADAVSVATDELVGGQPCLVLVDEAHKGGTSKDEKAWSVLRNELIDRTPGVEVELSATLAEGAGRTKTGFEIRRRYQHTIAFDYSYLRFHRDGYGKDYEVYNHPSATAETLDDLDDARPAGADADMAVAAYLSLLEQRLAYHDQPAAAARMNLESPLMLLLGNSVDLTKKADADVGRFLLVTNRLLVDETWAVTTIGRLLSGGGALTDAARVTGSGTTTVPARPFPYLERDGADPAEVYRQLRAHVFGGPGHLVAHQVLAAPGELALSVTGAKPGQYFGAVWVGSATDVIKNIAEPLAERTHTLGSDAISVGTPERLLRSVAASAKTDPALAVLIGAKMFAEGWSSYRVSTLGLLNVGSTKGAQIMQLFGRGVRLLGEHRDLRRSGTSVDWVQALETVRVFGHGADHLAKALADDSKEGGGKTRKPIGRLPVRRTTVDGHLPHLHLPVWGDEEPRTVKLADLPARWRVHLDLTSPKGATRIRNGGGSPLPTNTVAVLGHRWLQRTAHRVRSDYGLRNLHATLDDLTYLVEHALRLTPPAGIELPADARACDFDQTNLLRRWVEELLTAAIRRHTKHVDAQRRDATVNLEVLAESAPNLDPTDGSGYEVATITGKVDKLRTTLEKIRAVVEDTSTPVKDGLERLPKKDLAAFPLLYDAGEHLYVPLATTTDRDAAAHLGPDGVVLTSTEPDVLAAVLQVWRSLGRDRTRPAEDIPAWSELDLYIVRNKVASGLGVPGGRDFFPDFLLWLSDAATHRQVLALVDPKGLKFLDPDDPKLTVNDRLTQLPTEQTLPIRSYLVTDTPLAVMFEAEGALEPAELDERAEQLDACRVLRVVERDFSGAARKLLEDLRRAFGGLEPNPSGCPIPGYQPALPLGA